MNNRQAKLLAEVPPMYQGTIAKAYEMKCSPRAAIKAFCLHCTGYQRIVVAECTSYGCPLHGWRPFQKGAEDVETTAEGGEISP